MIWGGSGVSWTICESFVPRSRQITSPASVFAGQMPFLLTNQQRQSTEGKIAATNVTVISHYSPCLLVTRLLMFATD